MKKHFLLTILTLTICFYSCEFNQIVRPSGDVTKKSIPITDFSKINVANGIQLFVSKGNSEKVEMETDDNIHKLYSFEKKGEMLYIKLNRAVNFKPEQNVKVYISLVNFDELVANSGCIIKINDSFSTSDLKVKLSSGCQMNGAIICNNLNLDLTAGSQLTIRGKTDKLVLNSSSGCQINGFDLISNTLECQILGGTVANFTVNNSINVVASGGSILNYKGKATILSKDVRSGGQVNKI